MVILNTLFPAKSTSPSSEYPQGGAQNVTVSGDGTGTPWVASLYNDIIGLQQYLISEAGIAPSGSPDNALDSQQFTAIWRILNMRTMTHNITADSDYTLTASQNLKLRYVINDTNPFLSGATLIIIDDEQRRFIAENNTLQTLTFKTLAGNGIAVAPDEFKDLYCDGTDVIDLSNGGLEIASTAEAQAGTDNTKAITPLRMREGFNASGSAAVFALRAWVNFNGVGVIAIRASGNVSSLVDNGLGDYRANYLVAIDDANYAVSYNHSGQATLSDDPRVFTNVPSADILTTSVRVVGENASGSGLDSTACCIMIGR